MRRAAVPTPSAKAASEAEKRATTIAAVGSAKRARASAPRGAAVCASSHAATHVCGVARCLACRSAFLTRKIGGTEPLEPAGSFFAARA